MKKSQKLIVLLLVALLIFTAACSKSENSKDVSKPKGETNETKGQAAGKKDKDGEEEVKIDLKGEPIVISTFGSKRCIREDPYYPLESFVHIVPFDYYMKSGLSSAGSDKSVLLCFEFVISLLFLCQASLKKGEIQYKIRSEEIWYEQTLEAQKRNAKLQLNAPGRPAGYPHAENLSVWHDNDFRRQFVHTG